MFMHMVSIIRVQDLLYGLALLCWLLLGASSFSLVTFMLSGMSYDWSTLMMEQQLFAKNLEF